MVTHCLSVLSHVGLEGGGRRGVAFEWWKQSHERLRTGEYPEMDRLTLRMDGWPVTRV